MNKAELDHVWDRVRSVFEDEFRQRGWLPDEVERLHARIEKLESEVALLRQYEMKDNRRR